MNPSNTKKTRKVLQPRNTAAQPKNLSAKEAEIPSASVSNEAPAVAEATVKTKMTKAPARPKQASSVQDQTPLQQQQQDLFSMINRLPQVMTNGMKDVMGEMSEEEMQKISIEDLNKKVTERIKSQVPEKVAGLDVGMIMSTLLTNAHKLSEMKPQQQTTPAVDSKDNNPSSKSDRAPSVYTEAPQLPASRTGKYGSVQDEKNGHVIYRGFNVTLLSVVTMLIKKLPHKRAYYEPLFKIMKTAMEAAPTKAQQLWKEAVKGREDKLLKYSPENVEYICKNLKSIPMLEMLELEGEWHRFTTGDYQQFWQKLNRLQEISDMIESINPSMMTAIQNMTLRVNQTKPAKLDEQGKVDNLGELFQTLSTEVFSDQTILNGMKEMSADLTKATQESKIPTAPSFLNIMRKATSDV